jgi:hypothetical protein
MEFQLYVSIFRVQPCDLGCLVLVRKLSGVTVAHPQATDGLRKVLNCLMPLPDQLVSVSAVIHQFFAWQKRRT